MDFLKVDSLETAVKKIIDATPWLMACKTLPLKSLNGQLLAEYIYAKDNVPNFRRSAVDGYAVRAKDVAGAGESSPAFLQLIGAVPIGQNTNITIQSGQCVEVPTGGMVPDGADAVVMVEYTENFGENEIAISQPVSSFENIVEIGDDIKKGEMMFEPGKELTTKEIGALAAVGIKEVHVHTTPIVTIISTGDELHESPNTPTLPLGKIHDISSYTLKSLAENYGCKVAETFVLPDNLELLENTIRNSTETSNIVIISGGSSYGKYDITAKAISNTAKPGIFTHGLALKPGKPTILAVDEASKTLIIGLPGHPVSAMVVFELLLNNILPQKNIKKFPIPAKLTCNVPAEGGKMTVYPCKLTRMEGFYMAEPVFGKSATITTLTKSDGYFIINAGVEGLRKGSEVLVNLLI